MKEFTRDNFLAFMAEESVTDEDSTMISSHGMAEQVLERFDAWLTKPPELVAVVDLPVRQHLGNIVIDRKGATVMTCTNAAIAEVMVAQMNAGYTVPEDDDPFHPDEDDEDEDES